MSYILILCNVNNLKKAKEISNDLLDKKLVACANIIPKIVSLYRWEGKICEDEEYLMILKSRYDLFEEVKNNITKLHPYEVPEIISIDIKAGSKSYLNWLHSELR